MLESEDAFPVGLDADDRPALLFPGVVQQLGEIADLIDVLLGTICGGRSVFGLSRIGKGFLAFVLYVRSPDIPAGPNNTGKPILEKYASQI